MPFFYFVLHKLNIKVSKWFNKYQKWMFDILVYRACALLKREVVRLKRKHRLKEYSGQWNEYHIHYTVILLFSLG